jgi:Tfp pilus assembly protein PilE
MIMNPEDQQAEPVPQAPTQPAPPPTPSSPPPPVAPVTPVTPDPQTPAQPQSSREDPGKTLGIVGLVLTIVGLGLVGVVLAIVGLIRSKNAGFKNIPALIAIILNAIGILLVIPLLALISLTTFSGVQERAKDSERKTDINTIAAKLEAYAAVKEGYPTLADLNDPVWRSANGLSSSDMDKALSNPSAEGVAKLSQKTPSAVSDAYSYNEVSPNGCISPTDNKGKLRLNSSVFCRSFRLTALLQDGEAYTKSSVGFFPITNQGSNGVGGSNGSSSGGTPDTRPAPSGN